MVQDEAPVRVLYSFPLKLGADRICYTAWQQVNGLAKAGANVLALPGVLHQPVEPSVRVRPTLARGKLRLPYKVLGVLRTCALHDYLVSRQLEKLAGEIDIVHTWPLGALETLRIAQRLNIPAVLERPNAHTRFAYKVVQEESEKLGITLPNDDTHAYHSDVLLKEEEEYRRAFRLLCPSDFVVKTFVDQGTPREHLVRHQYGFDEKRFHPPSERKAENGRFTMLFAGTCAVRKGVHYALEAWLRSPAHENGIFLIAGSFLPQYAQKLSGLLSHPSVRVLGHRNDIPELMRDSDVLVLPTVEEGSPLVAMEAMGSGCVPLVSEVCVGACQHMETALVHSVGDVEALAKHITLLSQDRNLLQQLRLAGLHASENLTWDAAGIKLLEIYRETIKAHRQQQNDPPVSQLVSKAS